MRSYVRRATQKAEKLSKEQILIFLNEVMNENENLYSLLESMSAGLVIVNNDYHLVHYNTIAETRLSFASNFEEVKEIVPIWEIIEEEEIAFYLKNCAQKEITNSTEEFSVLTSGGSVRFLSITMSPFIHDGVLTGKIILINDITDKTNQEVLFHRMENLASLTNLAAGMAHEIKNPLGAISIHIQLIQKALKKAREDNERLPEKKFVENHIDVVNDEIEHLNKLVMDFLLAVRPINAKLELKEPEKIIQNTVDFLLPEFHKSKIEVEFSPSKTLTKIMIDEKLFREIIINFAQNALYAIKSNIEDYANKNEDFVGLFKIENFIKDNKFIIKIFDNGCGMSEDTVSKIFEPYYTTKANGTGLGMTMVYKIIKEFSGEILIDSKINVGTVFTLSFPIPQKDKLGISE